MEIVIETELTVGKVPDYLNTKFGKLQISSKLLAPYVGHKVKVKAVVDVGAFEKEGLK